MKNKKIIVVLILTFFCLTGFKGKDLLIAQRTTKLCSKTLKLKKNLTFVQKGCSFDKKKDKGTYRISNDTIYFDYEKAIFAIIEKQEQNAKNPYILKVFEYRKVFNDTIGHNYIIIKNNLNIKPIE